MSTAPGPAVVDAARPSPGYEGASAAVAWLLLCLRWFDGPHRTPVVDAVPAWLFAGGAALLAGRWIHARRRALTALVPRDGRGLALVIVAALAFRLPLAWHGAAGYVTSDGALSGLVALRIASGAEHFVFVPSVPYSGSLKSHLAATLFAVMDPARAFALASILFYVLFAAVVFGLAERALASAGAARAAGLYLAFAPAFVTRYSLSNDGNYVEVLALGTLALLALAVWLDAEDRPSVLPWMVGVLIGLAFWCHILAAIHGASVIVLLTLAAATGRLKAPDALFASARMAVGFAAGYAPGLLWNAAHGGGSFRYLQPGQAAAGSEPPSVLFRVLALFTDHLRVLLGYDFGYGAAVDIALTLVASCALLFAAVGAVTVLERAVAGVSAARAVLVLLTVNGAVAVLALPYIAGNPRYLLFAVAAMAVLIAAATLRPAGRAAVAVLVCAGAASSWAQAAPTLRSDAQWRRFVHELESGGVRWCYTDFFLAAKINFLSEERIVCSAKLGPTTTEYFLDHRERVERAPTAAFVTVNRTAAEKLQRRLDRLGVAHERRDLMKPVLLGLQRKVDPGELFPDREFPLR